LNPGGSDEWCWFVFVVPEIPKATSWIGSFTLILLEPAKITDEKTKPESRYSIDVA